MKTLEKMDLAVCAITKAIADRRDSNYWSGGSYPPSEGLAYALTTLRRFRRKFDAKECGPRCLVCGKKEST